MSDLPVHEPSPARESILNKLEAINLQYARDGSLARHPLIQKDIRLLRALEAHGLIEIKVVLLEKRWVVTAAGVLWMELEKVLNKTYGPHSPDRSQICINVTRDILLNPKFSWMRADECSGAAHTLAVHGLAKTCLGAELFGSDKLPGGEHFI